MSKKSALLIAAALAAASGAPARAAAWQIVDSTASVQIEVDLASAVRKDGAVTGWVQHTYSKKATTQTGAYFVFRTMKEQVRLNCAQQTATVLTRGYFDDDGGEIALIRGTGETRTVMPDTAEQRVLARLCNPAADYKPPTAKAAPPARPPAATATANTAAVDPRFMDGPPPAQLKPGIIRAKADGHDSVPAAAPAIVKPIQKPDAKAAENAIHKAEPAVSAPEKPQAPAREPAPAHESREATVARVMKARAGAPLAPESAPRQRIVRTPGAERGAGVAAGHEAHWDYEGEHAPYRWGDMKPDYAACKTGARQSPIDIRNPVLGEVEPIQFHYEEVPLKVSNNGHTIQVDYAPGSFILFGGVRYELVQFHFHSPSEERINGRAFDMVAHLVHKSAQGRLAVVAILLAAGGEQPLLQKVWSAMPGTRDRTRERLDVPLNARDLLPPDRTYYSYMGSLTTPPCTEGVQWLVMKTPVEISREQIAHFTALYPMNARPLQALNDRLIKVGK